MYTCPFYKCILLGNREVGKTHLWYQINHGTFGPEPGQHSQRDFEIKNFNGRRFNREIRLQLWDFDSFMARFDHGQGAIGVFLVYDITKRETFDDLSYWVNDVKRNYDAQIPVVLIGNKADLKRERKVEYKEGKRFAKENNMAFFEVSAKKYYSVERAFRKMAELIYDFIELIMDSHKCMIIGDNGVGKSNLKARVCLDVFKPWNGNSRFYLKEFNVKRKKIALQIWAHTSEQRFFGYEEASFQPTSGVILVYDITKRESFVNIARFLDETRREYEREFPIILVGNKVDLRNERVVSYEEGERFAKENELMFFETSSSTGENVKEAFLKMAEMIQRTVEIENKKKFGDQKRTLNCWQVSLLIVFILYILATVSKFFEPSIKQGE